MKRILTVLLIGGLLIMSDKSDAQPLRWGIKGGLNSSNISNFSSLPGITDTKNYTGWQAGLFVGAKFTIVAVEGDILYTLQGVQFEDVLSSTTQNLENAYINIPVVAKIFIIPKINLQAGLQYGILASSAVDGDKNYGGTPIKDQFKGGQTSLVFGLGTELSKFLAEIRYNLGVSDINDALGTADKLSSGVLMLNVGYRFK